MITRPGAPGAPGVVGTAAATMLACMTLHLAGKIPKIFSGRVAQALRLMFFVDLLENWNGGLRSLRPCIGSRYRRRQMAGRSALEEVVGRDQPISIYSLHGSLPRSSPL